MAQPKIPERFEILETITSDDEEILLRVRDRTLLREVILKLPGPGLAALLEGSDDRGRALREARALARVQHAGVIRLLEVIDDEQGPALVIEPVVGETLAEYVMREGAIDSEMARKLAIELASALQAAHEAGIVHRGLSASSITLRADGTSCLTNFSFAKFGQPGSEDIPQTSFLYNPLTSSSFDTGLTNTAAGLQRLGRQTAIMPSHPAPEQMRGELAEPRSDLFGLGWVLFECLTGAPPFVETNFKDWRKPLDPREFAQDVSRPLAEALMKCLAVSPAKRFQNAGQLRAALERKSGTGGEGKRRSAIGAWATAAGVLLVASLLVTFAMKDRSEPIFGGERGEAPRRARVVEEGRYAPEYKNSYALLIGIGRVYEDYGWSPLPNAENDVDALAAQLEAMPWEGWKVEKLVAENATREGILAALDEVGDTAKANDRILVYFAGHGVAHERSGTSGWMIPAGAKPEQEDRGRSTWLPFDDFANFFGQSEAKHILLAMDCCYSGRLSQGRLRAANSSTYSERYLTRKAHVVITSGRGDERVMDGEPGSNSPFMEAFLASLRSSDRPAITGSSLFTDIKEAFIDAGVGHEPQFAYPPGDSQSGEFVLFLKQP